MEQYIISINDSFEWRGAQSEENYAFLVFLCIFSVVEIPIMILTLIALCFLVKSQPAASVFVSHLILSDLIQVICELLLIPDPSSIELANACHYSFIASLYFMACVSFERYLLVSHPIWYKSHQSLKLSCFISVIIWCVPLLFVEVDPPYIYFGFISGSVACLIPYPIIMLCFVGTWRGLSRSISLTALKRKLILGSLFLVLLTYTFLILPFVIMDFIRIYCSVYHCFPYSYILFYKFYDYAYFLLYVNPLADCILYLFMRPDVGDLMKSVRCCRHQQHNQDAHSVVNPRNSCSTVVCSISAQTSESHSLHTITSVYPAAN